MHRKQLITTLVGIALLAIPAAQAHGHATVFEANGEHRCYMLTDGVRTVSGVATADPEKARPSFWVESNDLLSPSAFHGPVNEGAGLPVWGLPYWDLGEIVWFGAGLGSPGNTHPSLADGESGLQTGETRLPGPDGIFLTADDEFVPPDTQVTEAEFVARCLAPGQGSQAHATSGHDHGEHPEHAEGAQLAPLGLAWALETHDETEEGELHYQITAVNSNPHGAHGVLIEGEGAEAPVDTGIQLHDACILEGFDAHEDLLEPYHLDTGKEEPFYPYAYIIAQPDLAGDDEIGFVDAPAIEAATWFWAQHDNTSIDDHEGLHEACENLGGSFAHADVILTQGRHQD